jgi:phosphatidylserine decarboxylase
MFDVHVNRLPASGRIKEVIYNPGSFLSATLDKASVFNERNTVVMEVGDKKAKNLIAFTQIAGMLARRIVCDVHEGQDVGKGEVYGLIRFGSRCDLWLPPGRSPLVFVGQTMVAGETVVTDLSVTGAIAREGSIL